MSSLFVRHTPLAPLRRAHRAHRARARKQGLTGPVLLAGALAVAGHLASQTAVAAPLARPTGLTFMAASAPHSAPSTGRVAALLGEPTVAAAPASAVIGRSTPTAARTPARATRSTARRTPINGLTAVSPRKSAPRPAKWTRPSGGPLTSPYGSRWGRIHEGLDFGAPHGSPVRAAFDGVVVYAAYDGGYGKQIRIRHGNGVVTTYSHLSRIVVSGGRVAAGETIGKVGSTGSSTGPHLHFEVHIGGSPVNPRPYLAKRGVRV
ncbi:MAG TPA: M23 family metallopeptidase [Mycobacteriales bacterium]|nr:M23 family metallopeptidase [Mycobacteriales bacterium]